MTADLVARFWSRVDRSGDCWVWTGARTLSGYGRFYIASKPNTAAHRFSWELLRGAVRDGLQLDHLCRNRLCVNPAHLEPVTLRVNVLRGVGHSAVNAVKTHCVSGHEFTLENTIDRPRGRRECRECSRRQHREWYARNRKKPVR